MEDIALIRRVYVIAKRHRARTQQMVRESSEFRC